ncbi:hypothetical protein T492DRAFT_903266, partial [Pavlovales sp. CCMP2436]
SRIKALSESRDESRQVCSVSAAAHSTLDARRAQVSKAPSASPCRARSPRAGLAHRRLPSRDAPRERLPWPRRRSEGSRAARQVGEQGRALAHDVLQHVGAEGPRREVRRPHPGRISVRPRRRELGKGRAPRRALVLRFRRR